MDALQKNIAVARGEAIGASLLAAAALRTLFMVIPPQNRKELLANISSFVDMTLNQSGPGAGDADDEFNTQLRETARFQVQQELDQIAKMLREPGKG